MKSDSRTAPTRPPPEPGVGPPLLGVFGPCASPQHELASPVLASSKVTITSPPSAYAGDATILGIHCFRNASALTSPPGSFEPLHGSSWPSWHRLGVMNT